MKQCPLKYRFVKPPSYIHEAVPAQVPGLLHIYMKQCPLKYRYVKPPS
jgi:hypothetical protein